MKYILSALFIFIAASSFGLDIITRDGKAYWSCEVKKVERDGVRIMHRDGTAFLDFDELPSTIQKQYGWSQQKSEARKAERTAAAEAQRIAGENARRAQAEWNATVAKDLEQRQKNERANAGEKLAATTPIVREIPVNVQPENPDLTLWLKWASAPLVVLIVFLWAKRANARRIRNVEIRRQQDELRRFTEYAAAHNAFPTVATRILLKDGEVAFYDAPSALYEKRAVRYWVSGSIGFRVARGVYVGGTRGRSVSEQEWGKIDTGTLTITNRRIIFNGGGIDRTVVLGNVMAVEPWFDGVEISIEKRQKGMCFGAKNPVLVGALIQYLARGGSPGVLSPTETRNPELPPGA